MSVCTIILESANATHIMQHGVLSPDRLCRWDIRHTVYLKETKHCIDLLPREHGARGIHNEIKCGRLAQHISMAMDMNLQADLPLCYAMGTTCLRQHLARASNLHELRYLAVQCKAHELSTQFSQALT